MLNRQNQEQSSGDNSQNIQVAGNLIIGITEQRAKEIAIEIYKDNFIKLSSEAHEVAINRVEELVDDFLIKMHERNPQNLDSLKDPGMQASLYTAQKEYAKTGDKNLEETLVEMLVDRASLKNRDLKQIVLDESISTVSKLTSQQLDILTLVFILTRTQNHTLNNLISLDKYVKSTILPFVASITKEKSSYEHLVYSGCCIFQGIAFDENLENIIRDRYKAFFLNGFTKEQFDALVGPIENFSDLIIPNFHFPNKLQLNMMNEKKLEEFAIKKGITLDKIEKLKLTYNNEFLMSTVQVSEYLTKVNPELKNLFEIWRDSDMQATALTSVGIAIAQANFRRKTGMSFDLGIWIK